MDWGGRKKERLWIAANQVGTPGGGGGGGDVDGGCGCRRTGRGSVAVGGERCGGDGQDRREYIGGRSDRSWWVSARGTVLVGPGCQKMAGHRRFIK
jgi:hypothetical protein